MTDDDVFHAVLQQHCRGDLARIRAFFRKVYVFRAELDIRAFQSFADGGNVDGGNAYDHVAVGFRDKGRDGFYQSDAFGSGVVHFPVACNNRFTHSFVFLFSFIRT